MLWNEDAIGGNKAACLLVNENSPSERKENIEQTASLDHFPRRAEAFPVYSQESSAVAFSRFGCPRQLLTDQGPCFESALFQDLCRRLGIDKIRTTVYKPSTNGAVERFHRTLNSMLGKVVSQSQRDWDRHLPMVMAAYRATEHESTGFTPCKLFLGREMTLPIDLVLSNCVNLNPTVKNAHEFVADQEDKIKIAYETVRKFTKRLATTRAARYDLRVRPIRFKPGDWAWYYVPRRRAKLKEKWSKYFTGPYRILEQVGPVLFRIQKSKRSQPRMAYIDKLKPYVGQNHLAGI